jgi:hypothetical protein
MAMGVAVRMEIMVQIGVIAVTMGLMSAQRRTPSR